MKRFFFLTIIGIVAITARAEDYSNLQVSLLTVKPRPNEVYTIFGHTALRLYDPVLKLDYVLNWGTFDSDKPNFILLFLQGKTDYYLSTAEYGYFCFAYARGNSTVIEQVLDIPDENKERLVKQLQNNLLPENINYRYNFFFDNCTSRVRDLIEEFCGGTLVYPEQEEQPSFRRLIHGCTEPYPWIEFGIDLLIGNGADSLLTMRNELWLPEKLQLTLDRSTIREDNGKIRPVVTRSRTILRAEDTESPATSHLFISPLRTGFFLLALYTGILFAAIYLKRRLRLFGALLFLIAGIGGCIVAIISFFSVHPCTWPNWNILWIHPLHLIGFAGLIRGRLYRWAAWYHGVNFVLLSLVLLGWNWIPQTMNPACIPYILCLAITSAFQFREKGKSVFAPIRIKNR